MDGLKSKDLAVKCIWIEMYNTASYLIPTVQCPILYPNVLEFYTLHGAFGLQRGSRR